MDHDSKWYFDELSKRGIFVEENWIKNVINYVSNEIDEVIVKKEMLYELIRQYINSNVRQLLKGGEFKNIVKNKKYSCYTLQNNQKINNPSLSLNHLTQLHDVYLVGPIVFQVEQVRDISQPTNKNEKVNEEDEENNEEGSVQKEIAEMTKQFVKKKYKSTSRKRMLKLMCTNGVNDVFLVEHQYISFLDEENINQSTKIIVNNILCVRGLMFMTPMSVKILNEEIEKTSYF